MKNKRKVGKRTCSNKSCGQINPQPSENFDNCSGRWRTSRICKFCFSLKLIPPIGYKYCSNRNCKQTNPQSLDSFFKNTASKSGYKSQCKKCHNLSRESEEGKNYNINAHLIKNYGITLEQKKDMLKQQNSCCANLKCLKLLNMDKSTHVDHNHQTLQVRGILCDGCNRALGLLKDDVNRIMGLAEYLSKFPI